MFYDDSDELYDGQSPKNTETDAQRRSRLYMEEVNRIAEEENKLREAETAKQWEILRKQEELKYVPHKCMMCGLDEYNCECNNY
jgi:hypothetical protein